MAQQEPQGLPALLGHPGLQDKWVKPVIQELQALSVLQVPQELWDRKV